MLLFLPPAPSMFHTPRDCFELSNSNLHSIPTLQQLHKKAISLNNNPIYTINTDNIPNDIEWLSLKRTIHPIDAWIGRALLHLHTLILDRTVSCDFHLLSQMVPNLRHLSIMDLHSLRSLIGLSELHLETLQCDGTIINKLEYLPRSLQTLSADSCEIQIIQSRLPSDIRRCILANNCLFSGGIPLKWGAYLEELDLSHNYLKSFPRGLPGTLRILKLQYNRIVNLPFVLPESLELLNLTHNRVRELPSMIMRVKPILFCNVENNCLTYVPETHEWCKILLTRENWASVDHAKSVRKIQKLWRLFRLRKTLRNIYRCSHVRQELLATAMHPERAGKFEDIHPEWFTV
jgi:Leucine-rich repeat (LRR) protein